MRTSKRCGAPLRLTGCALGLVLAAGCSADPAPDAPGAAASPTASAADRACRAKWADLAVLAKTRSREGDSVRRAFASRWTAIEAGIDYYAQTATAGQCGDLLASRRTTIATTTRAVRQGLPYDAGQRRQTAFALRSVYGTLLDGERRPDDVRAAFATLSKQTPRAADDLAPAYDELARADPTDAKAVGRAVDDIALLADTSDAYRACSTAITTITDWRATLIEQK